VDSFVSGGDVLGSPAATTFWVPLFFFSLPRVSVLNPCGFLLLAFPWLSVWVISDLQVWAVVDFWRAFTRVACNIWCIEKGHGGGSELFAGLW
jgi:hypothetical protein